MLGCRRPDRFESVTVPTIWTSQQKTQTKPSPYSGFAFIHNALRAVGCLPASLYCFQRSVSSLLSIFLTQPRAVPAGASPAKRSRPRTCCNPGLPEPRLPPPCSPPPPQCVSSHSPALLCSRRVVVSPLLLACPTPSPPGCPCFSLLSPLSFPLTLPRRCPLLLRLRSPPTHNVLRSKSE